MHEHTSFEVETWKPIPGWEGKYEVSDLGRVRSLPRKYQRQLLYLKPILTRQGYGRVKLCDMESRRFHLVHRLVKETFHGPGEEDALVRHLNDIKTDNRLVNLEWGTHSDNLYDAVRNGAHAKTQRTHCPRGHVLEDPNLTEFGKRANRRTCMSCHRTHARFQQNPDLGQSFKEVADKYYEAIMKE